ncbi:putative FCP1-like protein [Cladobotryum mycophilum]|uniref:Mitochondrial import inner membrane translocase subunit TIM50 n=1 Tax=Cladobotryum mycophilum TaxID=491253 RepID=A0ABR0SMT7_9HYPO
MVLTRRGLAHSCIRIAFFKHFFSSKPLTGSQAQVARSKVEPRPPILQPSTALDYGSWTEPRKKKKNSTRHPRPKSKSLNMNVGSQNVSIPGLTLLKSMAPPHPATATPLVAANSSGTQGPAPKTPRYTGPKMGKFALRKQAAAEALARKAASVPPEQYEFFCIAPRQEATLSPTGRGPPGSQPRIRWHTRSHAPLSRTSPGPPSRLAEPRRILVIMDLNGTLLYRPNKRNPFNFIERPHARQFMSYCIETFHVAIWSSARPENVNKMVAQLLTPDQRVKCTVIWARDRFGLSPADYDSRVQCYKRLTTIWSDPAVIASHPTAIHGQRWDQTNTVLVDDSIEKGRSEPHNILEIPEFSGPKNEMVDVLPQVHDYLNLLCYQSDISRYMRQSPFRLDTNYKLGQPPSNE